jgi:hypothetical protein
MPAGVALVEDAETDGMGPGVEGERSRTRGESGAQNDGRGQGGERRRYSVTA